MHKQKQLIENNISSTLSSGDYQLCKLLTVITHLHMSFVFSLQESPCCSVREVKDTTQRLEREREKRDYFTSLEPDLKSNHLPETIPSQKYYAV